MISSFFIESDIKTNISGYLQGYILVIKKLVSYYIGAINNTERLFNAHKKKGLIKESVDPRKKAIEIFGMLEGLKTLMYYGASLSEVRQVWTSFANNLLEEIKSSLI